jgi:hypothetical protein
MTEEATAPTWTPDKWADFWRYSIGVNVLPADSKTKRPVVTWLEWQNKPLPEEMHNQWKEKGAFSEGIAIIPGKVWHNKEKQGLYFIFLDADKEEAITELCTKNGKQISLDEMAQKFIVEQHKDDPTSTHIYFYSPLPFPKKEPEKILGLEVKGLGEHGVANCAGSIHENGQQWEIIGSKEPVTLTEEQANELIQYIDTVCKKHGVEYLDKHYSKVILDSDTKIYEGTRHTSMISITDRLLFKHLDKGKSEEEIKQMVKDINNTRCVNASSLPLPLPDKEIEDIWRDALDYVRKRKQSEHEERRNNNSNNSTWTLHDEEAEEEQLAAENKLTAEDVNFVISTTRRKRSTMNCQ